MNSLIEFVVGLLSWAFHVFLIPEVLFASVAIGIISGTFVMVVAWRMSKNEQIGAIWRSRISLSLYGLGVASLLISMATLLVNLTRIFFHGS